MAAHKVDFSFSAVDVARLRELTLDEIEWGFVFWLRALDNFSYRLELLGDRFVRGTDSFVDIPPVYGSQHVTGHSHPRTIYPEAEFHPPTGWDYASAIAEHFFDHNPFSLVFEKRHVWVYYPNAAFKRWFCASVPLQLRGRGGLLRSHSETNLISASLAQKNTAFGGQLTQVLKNNADLEGYDLVMNKITIDEYLRRMNAIIDGVERGFTVHCFTYSAFTPAALSRAFCGTLKNVGCDDKSFFF
jgi:hypothetical protein